MDTVCCCHLEFSRAFEVFSDGDEVMSTANSVLNPFLKYEWL